MAFSKETLLKAWTRQGGVCASSGRMLVASKRGENSSTGGWESHHRKPSAKEGSDSLRNCVLFSVYPINYHFNVGHGGISWDNYEPLSDYELPHLYHGKRVAETRKQPKARRPTRKRVSPSIIQVSNRF